MGKSIITKIEEEINSPWFIGDAREVWKQRVGEWMDKIIAKLKQKE